MLVTRIKTNNIYIQYKERTNKHTGNLGVYGSSLACCRCRYC